MTDAAVRMPPRPRPASEWADRGAAWLRAGRGGMFLLALLVGAGSGQGAVAFRYLIYFFTWLATGHSQFGQQGYEGSSHLPWLGLGFFVAIPVIGGLIYGLVAVLAVIAGLIGLAFSKVVYLIEDLWDVLWKNRPEWARPAVGGLLLAVPQMYGVGYPVMYETVADGYFL